jgi:choline dehydrogenase-like flavoprotein
MNAPATSYDYDVLVIGSGFGGCVTALRLPVAPSSDGPLRPS